MAGFFAVGMLVRLVNHDEWGMGQIQSIVGSKITVNFENKGKVIINSAVAQLEHIADDCY